LKEGHGSAIVEETKNAILVIQGVVASQERKIELNQLSSIIKARLEQILATVAYEISKIDQNNPLLSGVIITGGGANLKNIALLSEYTTGMTTRIGLPNKFLAPATSPEMFKTLSNPCFSTVIGLVIIGLDMENQLKQSVEENLEIEEKNVATTSSAPASKAAQVKKSDKPKEKNPFMLPFTKRMTRMLNNVGGKLNTFITDDDIS
jgi:cell division protein FtsA